MIYTVKASHASEAMNQARAMNAQGEAPYEFYYAEAYLEKSREEAGEASYQDAITYARIAEDYARRAIVSMAQRDGQ